MLQVFLVSGCKRGGRREAGHKTCDRACAERQLIMEHELPAMDVSEEEEEEEEEGLFKADAVNEEDSERDRATQV